MSGTMASGIDGEGMLRVDVVWEMVGRAHPTDDIKDDAKRLVGFAAVVAGLGG